MSLCSCCEAGAAQSSGIIRIVPWPQLRSPVSSRHRLCWQSVETAKISWLSRRCSCPTSRLWWCWRNYRLLRLYRLHPWPLAYRLSPKIVGKKGRELETRPPVFPSGLAAPCFKNRKNRKTRKNGYHGKPNVSLFERGCIVRSVSCNGDHVFLLHKSYNLNFFFGDISMSEMYGIASWQTVERRREIFYVLSEREV